MSFFMKMAVPGLLGDQTDEERDLRRYRRIWRFYVTLTLFVSLMPLMVLTVVNHYLYRRTMRSEIHYDISRTLSNTARSLEFIVEGRISALELLIQEKSQAELSDPGSLAITFKNLKQSFGGFIDLGLIESNGFQRDYIGPYNLEGADYSDQDWFHEVTLRGVYVSDVFLGYRQFPHFVIAIKRDVEEKDFFVLRATVDMDLLNRLITVPDIGMASDIFLINRQGIMQTPSRFHGEALTQCSVPVPRYSTQAEIVQDFDDRGASYVLGYTYIEDTPFVLMVIKKRVDLMREWLRTRAELVFFLVTSIILIILVALWSATVQVRKIRLADLRRAQAMHSAEYTNKMATIGRLAASVAHEINNPLAIINEKAGLLHDLADAVPDFPHKDKTLSSVDSIIKSVDRCSVVTHRLLGFTRRMEMRKESIDLPDVLMEVLGFLGKEASHRNIEVRTDFPPDVPHIVSDRGQLQQIFLNIINNAFAALPDGGRLEMGLRYLEGKWIEITIADNGPGIPETDLSRIFEPFFSTKGEFGTGLGLSITYDLVQKLGGKISIESEVGAGTKFIVRLPVTSPHMPE
jgi:two-component system NtrC family sensor kinase